MSAYDEAEFIAMRLSLDAITTLHYRNQENRCAECSARYPCPTMRAILPKQDIWSMLAEVEK